jgi:GT2 family glycosyltransferase
MELSVIIVSYNVRYFLEQCLISVRKASEDITCEIFVVDNNSADGSCSMIRSEFPEVHLIMNHENRGFSAANNQALKLAEGRYILILNPDTIVEEDTFRKCIEFMKIHPDAGIIGVKMIDGKGRFLPESKRGIPTPKTAFYRMIGFAHLFPKSDKYNRYYLGNLDNTKTTKVEILSGAFMFMRREAFLQTGFLDENFFMHGEDIDYCYRVLKEGFRNYYFADAKIIHYKGESTRKEGLNVFIALHRAMIKFVRKHFSNGGYRNYILPIQVGILLRAGLSLLQRSVKSLFQPVTDSILIYLLYRIIASLWGTYRIGEGYVFPEIFHKILIPAYTAILILSTAFLSGYKIPSKTANAVKGVITGTIIILVLYALLPASLRFSRAIIVIGGLASLCFIILWRFLISLIFPAIADNPISKAKKTIVIGNYESYCRVINLISSSDTKNKIAGRVSIDTNDMREEVLGNIGQLREVIRINGIKEVIYTTGQISAAHIIDSMNHISDLNATIRFASAGETYIFGSRYVNPDNDLISISRPELSYKIWSGIKSLFK